MHAAVCEKFYIDVSFTIVNASIYFAALRTDKTSHLFQVFIPP